jgi:HAD superfamily hydrolase (TIGR01549 family)
VAGTWKTKTGRFLEILNMRIRAVIFDVDGTLVDTVDMHAKAWQRAFAEFGKRLAFEDVRRQIGKGGDQLMPVFLDDEELDKFGEELEERRGGIYRSEQLPQARPFPQVRDLFERVRASGLLIALASSAPEDELEHYKELTGVANLIEGATSADDAEESKPEPDIFAAAVRRIGVAGDECMVVGDTPYDAIAAGKIAIPSIGFLCGGFPESDLREAGCLEIYRDPADLLEKYEQSLIGRFAEGKASRLGA